MVKGVFIEQDPAPGLDDRGTMAGNKQTQRALRDTHANGGLGKREKRRRWIWQWQPAAQRSLADTNEHTCGTFRPIVMRR
jgi:hypothetical protein